MNNLYMGFDPDDETSPTGVTINMQGSDDFTFFCAANGTSCHNGYADCRISTSIYNKHMLVNEEGKYQVTMRRGQGIVFNQSAVLSQYLKCSYVYDGASFTKLYGGCGCAALAGEDCGNVMSAYGNHDCPYTADFVANTCINACEQNTSMCVEADTTTENVEPCYCNSPHLAEQYPSYDEDSTTQSQCYFKGAAFGGGTDETRAMLKRRVRSQATNGGTEDVAGEGERWKQGYWNELVLDANVVFEVLNRRPAEAIVAFVYKKDDPVAKANAATMAASMQFDYHMQQPVPLIAFDASVNVTETAPYSFESSQAMFASVTV